MWKYLPEERRRIRGRRRGGGPLGRRPCPQGKQTDARRPPELSTRDNVARAIYTEVKEGRGSPHGGVFLDISYLPAEHVRRKLPSMYEQFKELADVDITTGPMEVGPTTHYVMGGIRVDAETGATTVDRACSRRARWPAGCTARTGSAATRCRTCSSSARGPGPARRPTRATRTASRTSTRSRSRPRRASWPRRSSATEGEDPYAIQRDLQAMMQRLVGIFRVEEDLDEALGRAGRAAPALADGPGRPAGGPTTRAGTSSSSSATC